MKRAIAILAILSLVGCASIGTFTTPSQGTCDKIAYYDQYVESAQRAVIVLQFIPGVAGYAMQAGAALVIAAAALDDAQAVCASALAGESSAEQTRLALNAVFNAIQNFNTAYGKAKSGVVK